MFSSVLFVDFKRKNIEVVFIRSINIFCVKQMLLVTNCTLKQDGRHTSGDTGRDV